MVICVCLKEKVREYYLTLFCCQTLFHFPIISNSLTVVKNFLFKKFISAKKEKKARMDVNVKLFIFYEDISKDQGDCKRQTMISSLPVKASFIFFTK